MKQIAILGHLDNVTKLSGYSISQPPSRRGRDPVHTHPPQQRRPGGSLHSPRDPGRHPRQQHPRRGPSRRDQPVPGQH